MSIKIDQPSLTKTQTTTSFFLSFKNDCFFLNDRFVFRFSSSLTQRYDLFSKEWKRYPLIVTLNYAHSPFIRILLKAKLELWSYEFDLYKNILLRTFIIFPFDFRWVIHLAKLHLCRIYKYISLYILLFLFISYFK